MRVNWIIIVVAALCILSITAFGQTNNYWFDQNHTVIDSTVWNLSYVEQPGDSTCEHEWVSSGEYDPKPSLGCLVMHGCGSTCDWHWPHKDLICKTCGRMEHWTSIVISHCESPKSKYKEVKEKLYPMPKLEVFPDSFEILGGAVLLDTGIVEKWDITDNTIDQRLGGFRPASSWEKGCIEESKIEKLEARIKKLERQVKKLQGKNGSNFSMKTRIQPDTSLYISLNTFDTTQMSVRIIYNKVPNWKWKIKYGGIVYDEPQYIGLPYKYSRDGAEMLF